MRFGIASRPAVGMNANGDAYVIEEWNGQTFLAVIDGLGHGEEASATSEKAKEYITENCANDLEQIVLGLHTHLHKTRGVAAGLVRIDRVGHRLIFCGIGNIEVRVVSEPPMHPASLDGIIGVNLRRAVKFEYQYDSLRAVVLHSDGISGKFDLSDYPSIHEHPRRIAEQIILELGKEHDDATIIIAVEDACNVNRNAVKIEVSSDVRALMAAERAKELAKNLGFSEVDQTKIAIATSELARNIVVHAQGKGRIVIKSVTEPSNAGIMMIAEDKGPGIADVEKALQGGSSTKRGLGEGLGGVKRLMDDFRIETKVGEGTVIIAKKWRH